jgi:hypothetical protein
MHQFVENLLNVKEIFVTGAEEKEATPKCLTLPPSSPGPFSSLELFIIMRLKCAGTMAVTVVLHHSQYLRMSLTFLGK